MSNYQVLPGLGNVGSYLISATPWLSGSNVTGSGTNNGEVHFEFPYVTRSITVTNVSSSAILVHFASRANAAVIAKGHYTTLANNGDAWTFGVRCTSLYVSRLEANDLGRVEVAAELTSIEASALTSLSGSGINV